MTPFIRIRIECGADTCCAEPANFCPQMRTASFGTRYYCQTFRADEPLRERDGWLRRWSECIEAQEVGK